VTDKLRITLQLVTAVAIVQHTLLCRIWQGSICHLNCQSVQCQSVHAPWVYFWVPQVWVVLGCFSVFPVVQWALCCPELLGVGEGLRAARVAPCVLLTALVAVVAANICLVLCFAGCSSSCASTSERWPCLSTTTWRSGQRISAWILSYHRSSRLVHMACTSTELSVDAHGLTKFRPVRWGLPAGSPRCPRQWGCS